MTTPETLMRAADDFDALLGEAKGDWAKQVVATLQNVGSKTMRAHVYAWEAQVDKIANGLAVLGEENGRLREKLAWREQATNTNWHRERAAQRALRQLTFSPDGLPDTWPSPELVATILAGEDKP
jgi:pyruvate/2-oxoacid:ferredoxin oxidoreductase alpha subunit